MEGTTDSPAESESSHSAVSLATSSEPVKVYIRIRPAPSTSSNHHQSSFALRVIGHDQIQVDHRFTLGERVFRFDRIFEPSATQVEVYQHAVCPLVHKFYEGINCTIFAYGQTGSGKTYTIGSGCYCGEEREGIIARTIEDIFKVDEGSDNSGRLLRVSYIEIYKEELRDLLRDTMYPSTIDKDIHIREDDNGHTVISGIVEEEVRCVEDALGWLECGNAARITSATDMNTQSSRSHAVFTVSMVQEKSLVSNGVSIITRLSSKFHFVDLAGSERVSRTNNTGQRFKESVHINGGLLALGNVISAFADKRRRSSHIPYRDSKITRILKDSLGGSALTVMITCLSPLCIDVPETLNALKYAKRARNIKNHPIVNHASDKDANQLYTMRQEIQTLRNELHRVKETHPPDTPTHLHKVDSSVMVELGDQGLYVSHLKKKLQLVLDSQRAVYNEIESVFKCVDNNDDDRDQLSVVGKIYDIVQTNMAACNEVQEYTVVSTSTNTSHDDGNSELEDALQSVKELKHQLQTAEARIASDDEKCLKYVIELDKLQSECQHLVNDKTCLEQEMDELRREIFYLQNNKFIDAPNTVIEDGSMNNKSMSTLYSDNMDHIYTILHGTVNNLQDCDEKSCDNLLRELTDIIRAESTRRHGNQDVHHDCIVSDHQYFVEDNEIDELQQSITTSEHQLHHTEKRLLNAQHAMKSLNLQIRFKQELIKELVKNNSTFQSLNKAYQVKILNLEREQEQLKNHITKQKSSLKVSSDKVKSSSVSSGEGSVPGTGSTTEKGLSISRTKRRKSKSAIVSRQEIEAQERKLKETESKLQVLQRRRQDTLRILNMGEKSERRIVELEGEMERLRKQQVVMKKKLKGEYTKKRDLEEEVQLYKRQIRSLTESNKQQSQVIKVKTGEVALAQRKLRGYHHLTPTENQSMSQKWIDREIEKIIQERQALEVFQKELQEREVVIKNKEELLQEKHDLERRQSITSKEGMRLSQQMDNVNQQIITKEKLEVSFSGPSLNTLEKEINELRIKQTRIAEDLDKSTLHLSFNGQSQLTSDEEMRLLEISEQIEVLQSLLQIKNHSTSDPSTVSYNDKQDHSHNILNKISTLSCEEAQSLLHVYIGKVITLRQYIEQCKMSDKELKCQLREKDKVVEQLEKSLDQSKVDRDLRLTRIHKEHSQEVQLLLNQVKDNTENSQLSINTLQSRVKELERDLYYYKKMTRDLRLQLKQQGNHTQKSSGDHTHQDQVDHTTCSVTTKSCTTAGNKCPSQTNVLVKDSLEINS